MLRGFFLGEWGVGRGFFSLGRWGVRRGFFFFKGD